MGFAKYMEDNFDYWTENTRNSDVSILPGTLLNGLSVLPGGSTERTSNTTNQTLG